VRALALLLLLGCQGEPVVEVRSDAQPETAMEAGTCDEIAGNLVPNGSFEGVGGVGNWGSPLEAVNGGADHCTTWARFSGTRTWDATAVTIPLAGEANDVYEFGASVQRLDDELEAILVFLNTPTSVPATNVPALTPTPSTWVRVSGTLKLTEPVSSLTIGVGANLPRTRVIGVDRVWLRKK
jgi:hypothetical protein